MAKRYKRSSRIETTLLLSLACGSTVEAAALKSGTSKRTVYRYLDDPDFRKRLQDYRFDLLRRGTSMLTAATMEAVKALLELAARGNPHAARLGASKAILDFGLRLREATELEERMAKIEEALRLKDDSSSLLDR